MPPSSLEADFEFDWGKHAKQRVPPLAIVEDLEVLEDGAGKLDPGVPALTIEELDRNPAPERLDDSAVEAVTD